ncbi:MAG: M28 family peptidase, partial [Bacteroidetes bacterium]|nr:M28 family peptidase [Bacteroidota bacterium]
MKKILILLLIPLLGIIFTARAHIPDSLVSKKFTRVQQPFRPFLFKGGFKSADTAVVNLLNQVNEDTIGAFIQHLQDFGTRDCNSPQALLAQDWIWNKLLGYGYSVLIQNFPLPANSSDNVIATLPGTIYPNEFVVLGAHYDSYTGGSSAPGADDNASGTAGILEIARVLSQHSFDRSIVLCLWSAEEYGLYGSDYYAQEAAAAGMNILGYLNLDMTGYQFGTNMTTNVVGPASAQPLLDFYHFVCSQYLPSFQVIVGGNLPGGSDHMSFNSAGFMGIFPFEDVAHYSPFIHTPQDLLGTSVNSLPQSAVFARSVMATAIEMATLVPPPVNLTGLSTPLEISLSWKNPGVTAQEYRVYRDDMSNVYVTTTDTFYSDQNVVSGKVYEYAVSLVDASNMLESFPSDHILLKAVGPLPLPFSDNFENGLTYWITRDGWDLTTEHYHSAGNSVTDSPGGTYSNQANNNLYLLPFRLDGYSSANLEFWR